MQAGAHASHNIVATSKSHSHNTLIHVTSWSHGRPHLVKVLQCKGKLGGRVGSVLHGSYQEDGEVMWSPLPPLQICVCLCVCVCVYVLEGGKKL